MRIGFIGLGDIGMPMARRLHAEGHEVRGADISVERTKEAQDHGIGTVGAPSELEDSEVLCLAVSDDAAVEEALTASELLRGLAPGSTVLIHSTVLPESMVRLEHDASTHEILLHDAPVSGGAARALAGTLTLMVGGAPGSAAQQVLNGLGRTVQAGPVGAGSALKLTNQLAMLAALQAMHEGLDLAHRHGVSTETVLDTLRDSTGDNWVARNWGFFPKLAAAYDEASTPVRFRPWSKDLWDVVAAARQAELPVPLAGVLAQILPDEVEHRARQDGDAL